MAVEHAAASPLSTAARVSALVYAVVYVTAAVLTLHALIAGPLLVLGGVMAQAVAFVAWSQQLLVDSYVVGTPRSIRCGRSG